MTNVAQILDHKRVSGLAALLVPDQEVYLVGGAIRDALLGRAVNDFDFAMPFDPTVLARAFARKQGGGWFMLDEQRRQSRVVFKGGGEEITFDFAPFRAADLTGDQRLRDFTVNSLAMRLCRGDGAILDPLGGREDLEAKRLRACSEGVFADDPLRVLKGIRHAVVLGFGLEEETRELMSHAAAEMPKIAAERLRAEIAAIFSVPEPEPGLELLRELGLDGFFFGCPESGGGFDPGAAFVRRARLVIGMVGEARGGAFCSTLHEELEGGFDRSALLRLAAFLRGYGVKSTETFSERVRLGKKATALLRALALLPTKRAGEIDRLAATRRGRALWATKPGPDAWMNLLFVAVLDGRSPSELAPLLLGLMDDLRCSLREGRVPDLVDGAWIRDELGWSEGPPIGRALATLRQWEIEGRVTSAEEARKFLKSLDQKMIDKDSDEPL